MNLGSRDDMQPGGPFVMKGRQKAQGIDRRPLLMTGFVGVSAGHILLGLLFLLPESMFRSILILAAMLVVVFFIQAFIGTLVWLAAVRDLPLAIRGFAMGTAVSCCGRRTRSSPSFSTCWRTRSARPGPSCCSVSSTSNRSCSRCGTARRPAGAPSRSSRTTSGSTTLPTSTTPTLRSPRKDHERSFMRGRDRKAVTAGRSCNATRVRGCVMRSPVPDTQGRSPRTLPPSGEVSGCAASRRAWLAEVGSARCLTGRPVVSEAGHLGTEVAWGAFRRGVRSPRSIRTTGGPRWNP